MTHYKILMNFLKYGITVLTKPLKRGRNNDT